MRMWKILVLLGGIAGVTGFFLPFVVLRAVDGSLEASVSAYQIVKGIDDATEVIDVVATPVASAAADDAAVRQLVAEFNDRAERYRSVLIGFYVPAVLLALLGALAGIRHRMGRLAGLFAIALGAINAGIWMLFYDVMLEPTAELTVRLGSGTHALLAAGLAGLLAGLGALIVPDRGPAPAA